MLVEMETKRYFKSYIQNFKYLYTGSLDKPRLNLKIFWSKNIIFDIGCSIQVDSLKAGLLDVGLEI